MSILIIEEIRKYINERNNERFSMKRSSKLLKKLRSWKMKEMIKNY